MSLTYLTLLSIPSALVAFNLAMLALATVWAARAVFDTRGLLVQRRGDPLPAPVPLRSLQR